MMEHLHAHFFKKSQTLSEEQRKHFVALAHLYIELKCLEFFKPHFLIHGSKDGLDYSATHTATLIAFIGVGQQRAWGSSEIEALFNLLFVPALIVRERALFKEEGERLCSLIKLMEKHPGYLEKGKKLFKISLEDLSFHF